MTARHSFSETLEVLRIRDFRYFLGSRFCATLASQMQALVVSWQIYQLTHDPLSLGLIGLVEAVTFIAFALWAGHVADRHEKRFLIFTTQSLMAVCSLLLWFMSRSPHWSTLWIYAVIGLTGIARSFMWPASFAYSELTVPRAIYSRAASMNSTGWEIGSITGPAIGGILYAWKGPVIAYATILALSLLALAFTSRMGKRHAIASVHDHSSKGFLSGVRFVFANPLILAPMSLDMFAVLFGGVYALLPIFADRLGVGAQGLGWLRAAPSLGAILMAVYQSYRPPYERAGRTLLISVAIFGASILAFAYCDRLWPCLLLLAISGMADNVSVVIRSSIVQAFTPDAMRGRVSSVNGIFIGSSNEIGAFESGLAAKLMGTVPSVVFGGAMTLVTVGVVALVSPSLRRLGRISPPISKEATTDPTAL